MPRYRSRAAGEVMGVGDGDGERVGRVGARYLHAGKQPLDHGMDLRLLGAADPDHRLLDQPRRIFADLDAAPRGRSAARRRAPGRASASIADSR
jgi:hypothetical protein